MTPIQKAIAALKKGFRNYAIFYADYRASQSFDGKEANYARLDALDAAIDDLAALREAQEPVAWPCNGCARHQSNAGDTDTFDRYEPVAAPTAPAAQPVAEPPLTPNGELKKQLSELADASRAAGAGVAVRVPPLVEAEGRKFMRGEPSLFDNLTVGELQEAASVVGAAAPAAQPEDWIAVDDEQVAYRLGYRNPGWSAKGIRWGHLVCANAYRSGQLDAQNQSPMQQVYDRADYDPVTFERLAEKVTFDAAPAQAEPLSDADIAKAIFAVLRAENTPQLWAALTFDHGPYEVTSLRASALRIARAVLAAKGQA